MPKRSSFAEFALQILVKLSSFMSNMVVVSRKVEDAYHIGTPTLCSPILVESKLLICFCILKRVTLVISCSLLCVFVFFLSSFYPSIAFFSLKSWSTYLLSQQTSLHVSNPRNNHNFGDLIHCIYPKNLK